MKRLAAIISGTELVNMVVLADGQQGDAFLAARPDAVEVTGMDPQPKLGIGWTFVDGVFVPPPVEDEV